MRCGLVLMGHVELSCMSVMRLVVAALVLSVTACTGAELFVDQDMLPEALRQQSQAQVCVPDALREEVPYKLLFVIDTSGSNATSDPTPAGGAPRREVAVRNAINANITKTNVSFGVITFSDEPVRQTFGYTRDTTVLAGALENIGQAQGGTNYSNTLWAAIDFIQADIESLSASQAARTHYIIFWLSDGFPTVGVTDGSAITPGVLHLCDTFGARVAELSFNTAFLGGSGSASDQEDAQDLLADMAEECPGGFVNIPSGGAFSFDVNTDPVIRKYELALYTATNLNVRLGEYGPAPDSDGDGLLDAEEVHWKTDSINMDTDNDGVRDGIEVLVSPLRSPTRVDGTCPNPGVDTDDDGLYDCEEVAIGTSPTLIDTDGDLLPDGLEALTGGLPVKDDPTGDADLDGMLDSLETKAHLPVRLATDPEVAANWSYNYGLEPILPAAGLAEDKVCYDLTVSNIALRETQPTRITAQGLNRIEIWAVFRPVDLAGEPVFYRARREVRLLEFDALLDPPSGFPDVLADDFVLVGSGLP